MLTVAKLSRIERCKAKKYTLNRAYDLKQLCVNVKALLIALLCYIAN